MRVSSEELTLENSSLPAWTRLRLSPCPHLSAPGMPTAKAAGSLGLIHRRWPEALGRGHSVMKGSVTAPQSCVQVADGRQGRALQNAGSLQDSVSRETPGFKIRAWGESHGQRTRWTHGQEISLCVSGFSV